MASMKEHMKNLHTELAAGHRMAATDHKSFAECDRTLAECYKTAMKAADGDMNKTMCDTFTKSAAAHTAAAKRHESNADSHDELAAMFGKAIEQDLQKLVPDGVRGITAIDAPASAFSFGISARPRIGAPPISSEPLDKSAIPPQFAHLISPMTETE